GDEKGVHVHMEDARKGGCGAFFRAGMEGSKSRQVGHDASLRLAAGLYNKSAFRGDDAGDGGEILCDGGARPEGRSGDWVDGGQRVATKCEDDQAARFEMCGGLGDELGINFIAFLAAVESDLGLVVPDFTREGGSLAATDVGRV